jgi:hypothetical protein
MQLGLAFGAVFFMAVAAGLPGHSQTVVRGCTDPQASNYNRQATASDGSCIYQKSTFRPTAVANLPKILEEVSGMVYWNGSLVMLNDGGHPPILYMVDTTTHQISKVIELAGASNVDWEDLAQDSTHFYVGDFGNNNGNRKNLVIYKVAKNAIGPGDKVVVPAEAIETIRFTYPNQTDFTFVGAHNTRFDCEAMIAHRGKLHLFSKNWVGAHSLHYTLPSNAGEYEATLVDSINTVNYLITGAASAADNLVLLCGYTKTGVCGMALVFGFDETDRYFFTGNTRFFRLPSAATIGQLESVCFANPTRGWMASERFAPRLVNVSQQYNRFNTLAWIIDFYKKQPRTATVPGALRYNATKKRLELYDGAQWRNARF